MARIRRPRGKNQQVKIGTPDPDVTGAAGVEAFRQLDRKLPVTATLDAQIGPVKERDRGLTAGEFLTSAGCTQLTGGRFLVSLDRRRADVAGQLLEVAPTPASTTARKLAQRFGPTQLTGIEVAFGQVNARVLELVHPVPEHLRNPVPGGQRVRVGLAQDLHTDLEDLPVQLFGRLVAALLPEHPRDRDPGGQRVRVVTA